MDKMRVKRRVAPNLWRPAPKSRVRASTTKSLHAARTWSTIRQTILGVSWVPSPRNCRKRTRMCHLMTRKKKRRWGPRKSPMDLSPFREKASYTPSADEPESDSAEDTVPDKDESCVVAE